MTAPHRVLVGRSARRIVWQSTALVAMSMLLLCGVAAIFVTRSQDIAVNRTLRQVLADADAVTDPPAGILVYQRHEGHVSSSPQLTSGPLDPAAFARVAAGGPTEMGDANRNGREYRLRTGRRDESVVQVAYDLTELKRERTRLFTGLVVAALCGVVLAFLVGRLIASRAVAPLGLAIARQQRFVADASHELRTPLTQAHTRAQLLLRELHASSMPEPIVADAERLVHSTRQLGEIVEELLMSAQLQAEPQHMRPVDMAELARAAVDAEQVRAAERELTIDVESNDGPHLVPGEPTALRRVINSLIDNAIGHSATGGAILVTVRRAGGGSFVQLSVRDHGVGFTDVDPDSVFERFARGSHGAGRRYGLGLALVREVIVAHRGEITARNAEGGGAEFIVSLPIWSG